MEYVATPEASLSAKAVMVAGPKTEKNTRRIFQYFAKKALMDTLCMVIPGSKSSLSQVKMR
jgi:hypothetical protein